MIAVLMGQKNRFDIGQFKAIGIHFVLDFLITDASVNKEGKSVVSDVRDIPFRSAGENVDFQVYHLFSFYHNKYVILSNKPKVVALGIEKCYIIRACHDTYKE